ncbi:uncharacterized protein C4orf54 homolog [Hoplias malabaricus]|uniref:uncharacterized protein C4orf54 homolog n=1 Tax=Hoplias malabaricus TaxID=27720 RepID=UPI003461E456
MAASPRTLRIHEPRYADLNELLDAKVKLGFNGEADHVATAKQSKWLASERAGARTATVEEKDEEELRVSASSAQFPDAERRERARTEDEEEDDDEDEGEDEYESAHEHLSVKSDECEHGLHVLIAEVLEDESHYITTHEIQLCELDHDTDCDVSTCACSSCQGEDEHQIYTFVDYASFEREDTIVEEKGEEREKGEEEEESAQPAGAQPESGRAAGRVHVAIRAVHEFRGDKTKEEEKKQQAERVREGAPCLIAVPGRLHIGGSRLKGGDAREHSSDASSAVSELDEADKEVRNLTARAFRSLAYPYTYPCALSFSTSSESSAASERWSALVDHLKKAPAASALGTKERSWARECGGGVKAPPVELLALNGAARADKLGLVLRCERLAPDGMEDTHRRATLASSLLKSVLSKKVQFERERRMERGEIHEPEKERARERERENENEMETEGNNERENDEENEDEEEEEKEKGESDISLVSLDELADVVDGGGSSRESPAKKGARCCGGGALPRSQNSAFRSWRDGALEFHEDHAHTSTSSSGKATKMSRLFLPSIQSGSARGHANAAGGGGTGARAVVSKPPEIKISLRKSDPPLKVASALAAALRSEPSERVPHFTVRDVRDNNNNKGKLQTPIHQVRDVRKLVKSSYHFVSLEGSESKGAEGGEQKKPKGNPAIVIKCQSVNTNTGSKQSGGFTEPSKPLKATEEPQDPDLGSSQGSQVHKPPARVTPASLKQDGLKIETWTTARKQDKGGDVEEKKTDSKMAALEKLQAAVKTMEQLYVFDKKEWKRKNEPQPLADSHVLSLITSKEHDEEDEEQANSGVTMRRDSFSKNPPAGRHLTRAEVPLKKDERAASKVSHHFGREEHNAHKTTTHLGGSPGKSMSSMSLAPKISTPITVNPVKAPQVHSSKPMTHKSPKLPLSLKTTQLTEERERPNGNEAGFTPVQFTSSADSENYLTIPVKPPAKASATPAGDKAQQSSHESPKRSSIVMDTRSSNTPTATIYHHPLPIMQAATPQVICFSPTVQPSPVPSEHFHTTQRKMLLDPTTGNYYLVDTPVQPASRRLFDPETGQYVDVPMPPQPPMTPVPMPISPLAISPGAYAHTYMFYPGYMPTTVIPARIQSQLSVHSEVDLGDKGPGGQQGDGAYMEGPYYMPSGKGLQTTPGVINSNKAASTKQPVISISSQQGPRIIAPPSFDGTTMSFVVEHR